MFRNYFVTALRHLLRRKLFSFINIAGLALGIAVSFLILSNFLDDAFDRVTIGPGIFLASGVIALGVALLTISARTVRAASANPVQSLRYE